MDTVEVEITGLAITSRYGTLSTGHRLATDAAFAAHLVNDARCARYVEAPKAVAPVPAPTPTPVAPRRARAKAVSDVPAAGVAGDAVAADKADGAAAEADAAAVADADADAAEPAGESPAQAAAAPQAED